MKNVAMNRYNQLQRSSELKAIVFNSVQEGLYVQVYVLFKSGFVFREYSVSDKRSMINMQ